MPDDLPQDLKEVRDDCHQLLALLDDPHPGLVTWATAVGGAISRLYHRIADLAETEEAP